MTFESKFGAFVPEDGKVQNINEEEVAMKDHNDAGIITKGIAYLIDIGVSIFIIPLFYNIYRYLKRGQTLGQQIMGIRIYRHHHVGIIAHIPQLINRFIIKLLFVITWAVIGINLLTLVLQGLPEQISHMIYLAIMIVWLHLYVYTMFINKHRRGIQDLWSGTTVAYDHGRSLKRFVLGTIFCAVLYYGIIGLGPDVMSRISSHMTGAWIDYYRQGWTWIDTHIFAGISQIGL